MSKLHLIDDERARGQKVFLATPVYGSPDASYTASLWRSREALSEAGIQSAYALLSGNTHVDDGRNDLVAEFLATDCTELVFLDADVSWQPEQLVRLCQHADIDIVGGVYPKRSVTAEDMPVRMLPGITEPDESGLLEVDGLPTGFLRIKRYVLEAMAAGAQKFDKAGVSVPIVFERDYVEGIGRRGGDIGFCMRAREMGFSVQADCELMLGHAAQVIVRGSLGQALRKQRKTTLSYVASRVRLGDWTPEHIHEALDYCANGWGAQADSLIAAIKILERSPGAVLEAGSGLSTVLMAAAVPDHYVYCLEHDPLYAMQLRRLAKEAGIKNIGLVEAPIDPETNWYSLAACEGIAEKSFALGFVDGPPRVFGSRTKFITHCAPMCEIIIADDADDPAYQRAWANYAERRNRKFAVEGRLAIIK